MELTMNCPKCGKEMAKRSSYGGVEMDLCVEHGIWLDKDELRRILEGHAEDNRQPPNDDRHHGRLEGIFLGWWSLFMPK